MVEYKNKAVFLDRDGTINVDKNYLYRIEDFEFLPGVIEALREFQSLGFMLVIITNQSGIARGYYTEEDFERLNNWMFNRFKELGVHITRVYYCPHLSDASFEKYRSDCDCRKPKLGMFFRAVEELNIDLNRSIAIGDKIRDCKICIDTNCKGFLINYNEDATVIKKVIQHEYNNIIYVKSIQDVVTILKTQ